MADWTDFIGPVLNFGSNLYDNYNKQNTQGGINDLISGMINRDYQDQLSYNDAAKQYNDQYYQYMLGEQAASNSAAAARASAARTNEVRGRQAAKKANKKLMAGYNSAKSRFQPYADVGSRVMPQIESTYGSGLGLLGALQAYLQQPNQMAKLSMSKPAWMNAAPLPNRK